MIVPKVIEFEGNYLLGLWFIVFSSASSMFTIALPVQTGRTINPKP